MEDTDLVAHQRLTLESSRLKPAPPAKALFLIMDVLYGKKASLGKFRVLEVVARVPYIAWEQTAYIAITHVHSTPKLARDIYSEVKTYRGQQDNEMFHLLILEELLQRRGDRQGMIRFRIAPQLLAWFYYYVSWLLYVIRPKWSHQLNANFEDHAEHEYMQYVADHPELEGEEWVSDFKVDYGDHNTVANLLRQIGLDERHHKNESLARIEAGRFEVIE